ncbi:MAG: RNA methyltransferase [Solobacterium sp.]|nr:RNA methyltransferase [Solobacterium sp.]
MIIEGNISVKAAILGGKREIEKLFVDEKKKDKDLSFIIHQAMNRNIPVEKLSRESIDNIAQGRTHGGCIAVCETRREDALEDCLQKKDAFVFLVEGVEDPYNLGYIIRSLYAAGCDGLLLRKRDWKDSESVILKSSAGALDYMHIVMSDDLSESVGICKANGFRCYAAMRKDAISYFDVSYQGKSLIAVGGEMRGLSKGVLAQMDQNIFIPYANDFRNALNAASACTAIGFEIFRQRQTL